MSPTNGNYSLNASVCLTCHLSVLFCSKLFQKHKYCIETEKQNELFVLSVRICFATTRFSVVFLCSVYTLVNLFAEIIHSKYNCVENITTKNYHFSAGSIELLVGFLLSWNFVRDLLMH